MDRSVDRLTYAARECIKLNRRKRADYMSMKIASSSRFRETPLCVIFVSNDLHVARVSVSCARVFADNRKGRSNGSFSVRRTRNVFDYTRSRF